MSINTKVPKAILYFWPDSVWSTVPRICLEEKGYSEDEYILKQVDISKGENFSPSYLKINMNGTVPTLVVPTLETTGTEVDTRFRSLRDTIARNSHSARTTSSKPAPALAPATIEGKAVSDELVALIHDPSVDPNFLLLAARTSAELETKAKSAPGKVLTDRKSALDQYVNDTAKHNGSFEQKMLGFLKEKATANDVMYEIYYGGSADRVKAFCEASDRAWSQAIPAVMKKLEELIKGPYALGDQVSLADFHVIAWLARIIKLSGGDHTAAGIDSIKAPIGPKLRVFWSAWVERPSFKKVYAQALH